METILAERVYDCGHLYVAQRTVYGGILLHGITGALVGADYCRVQSLLYSADTSYFPDYILAGDAGHGIAYELRPASLAAQFDLAVRLMVLLILRGSVAMANAGGMGDLLEIYLGDAHDNSGCNGTGKINAQET